MTAYTADGRRIVATVFSKPQCPPCDCTKRMLDKLDIPVRIIDVSESPDVAEFLRGEGFASLPVVFPANPSIKPWTGFRPTLLDELT
jgi:glutaredoxin-like protein NrdH